METSNAITENIQIIFSTDKEGIANSINPAAHRYYYKKIFDTQKENILTFVMLNPSDADQYKPDPTIRNIETIVKDNEKYNGFAIINLFSYRTAKPKDLKAKISEITKNKQQDDFKTENLKYLNNYVKGDVVLAWGTSAKGVCNKFDKNYYKSIMEIFLKANVNLYSYSKKLNNDKSPKHPGPLSFNKVASNDRKLTKLKINTENNKYSIEIRD